ncbi:DUF1385 domain-containing protein [Thermogemmatispora sp.]|uniref:DUF1385 domain-containing protein n=1 Tax=Thermogemmatispora sp. TaxID=1968838 RepID=UPI001D4BDAE9|nr:DUF1385 domain-containing protein [Thermogemmatispora sp.]MBX5449541.1 DUF1385 domain-containing protein [Thermogemmatispora sp.]
MAKRFKAGFSKFYYGGQAVMEGVMMRGRTSVAMAVRRPDGSIYLYEEPLQPRLYRNPLFRLPFLRGLLLLWETLVLGTRMMALSANVALGLEEPARPGVDEANDEQGSARLGGLALAGPLVISLGFAIALFFLLPVFLASLVPHQVAGGWLNLWLEGLIRLALLIGYLLLIGRLAEVQRVFGYHGAEHKAINAMEHGDPLDVPHVRAASRVHTRCGTGFLLLVVVISIVVFALLGFPSLWLRLLSRVLLVPVIAALAYELLRLGAAWYHLPLVRFLLAPSLALQGLTTREPDDSMIECAIVALERVMQRDAAEERAQAADLPPLVTSR